jgi:SAM-dependent methyltransferase
MIPLPAEDIFGNTKKLKFILDAVASHRGRLKRDIAILDFGCGNATGVGQYLIGDGVRYVGVDFHEPSLTYAREHFGGPNVRFLDAVPPDMIFDIIVYSDLLEHVHDPLAILRAQTLQLAADGIVIGSVPNGYGPCEIEKFIDHSLRLYRMLRWVKRATLRLMGREPSKPSSVPYNSESGHVIFFTLRSLRRMVSAAGFRIVQFRHAGFVGADLTGSTIFSSPRFVAWNVRISDRLPAWMVSAWHFVLVRGHESGRGKS